MRPSLLSLIILLGAPLTALLSHNVLESPGDKPLINGEWQLAYEKQFDKGLSLRDAALTTWGIGQFVLFKEGREGALVGNNGWVYSSEEFIQPPNAAVETEKKLALIKDIQKQLAAKNIRLVIALLPDKSRIYPENMGRYRKPAALETRYDDFRAKLQTAGITVPDLKTALLNSKKKGDLFLHTDTHWTPLGTEVAAQTLAAATPKLKGKLKFATTAGNEQPHEGDLLNFIPLGDFGPELGLPPDVLAVPETESAETNDSSDLFDANTAAGALVGTSYSANPKWNFEGALKQAYKQDFINVAEDGKGPIIPMQEYLASDAFTNEPPRFVVWDIPERFLGINYDKPAAVHP